MPRRALEDQRVDTAAHLGFASRAKRSLESIGSHIREPMYRDAYFLMANTASTSVLGLLYWTLAAHLFPTAIVGEANAMMAAVMLMSAVAQLNFQQVLQRFLPITGRNSRGFLWRTYALTAFASVLVGTAVFAGANIFLRNDYLLSVTLTEAVFLIACVCIWTIFALQDAALIGMRHAKWVFVENTLFGVAKIVTLLVAAVWFISVDGVIASWILPTVFALFLINYMLFSRFVPSHHARATGNEPQVSRRMLASFISGDYVGWISGQLLALSYPLLVSLYVHGRQGQEYAAYLSIAVPIGTAINLLTSNLMSSFVVEASADEANMGHYARMITRRITFLIYPAAALLALFAPWLLLLGGRDYQQHATGLLRLLALSAVPISIIALASAIARVQRKTWKIGIIQFSQVVAVLVLMAQFVPTYHLTGLGLAVLMGSGVVAICITPMVLRGVMARA